jgi:hypothetical protein
LIPGLIDALSENLKLQKENPEIAVVTDINRKIAARKAVSSEANTTIASVLNNLVTPKGKEFFPWTDFSNGKCHLMIAFSFPMIRTVALQKTVTQIEHDRFLALDCFKLFKSYKQASEAVAMNCTDYMYAIDLGEDVEGSARIISKVLQDVYEVDRFTEIEYFTVSSKNMEKLEKERDKASGRDKQNLYSKTIYWILAVIGFIIYLLYQLS